MRQIKTSILSSARQDTLTTELSSLGVDPFDWDPGVGSGSEWSPKSLVAVDRRVSVAHVHAPTDQSWL